MKSSPIPYKKHMILAKKNGWKTVTRRPISDKYLINREPDRYKSHGLNDEYAVCFEDLEPKVTPWLEPIKCPYGQPGDQLYIKENYQILQSNVGNKSVLVEYKADGHTQWMMLPDADWERYSEWKEPFGSKASRFMYKSLSRFWDEVTEITVERIQDITHQEAIREGIYKEWDGSRYWYRHYGNDDKLVKNPTISFRTLWQSMYEGGPFDWNNNPFVWVVRYKPLIVNGKPTNP